jgi:hypothetical protein
MTIKGSDHFAHVVNTIHNLESAWLKAKIDGADRSEIERTIRRLISEVTDDELGAYGEYIRESSRQAQDEATNLSHALAEMESI